MPSTKSELKGKVTLNSRAFQSRLRRIKRRMRQWGAQMRRVSAAIKTAMVAVTAVIAGVSLGVLKLVKMTANAGDAFDKLSLKTGISAEALSEYAHVAEITGTNQATIQRGLKSFARSVSYAKDGLATYTREFDKLGISMDDLDGKSPQEAFEMTLGALGKLDDELQRSATAQAIFGRAGQELLPMVKLGADGIAKLRKEAHELGIVFDQEAAAKSAQFNDNLTRLKGSLAGIRNKQVLAFIDEFSGGIEKLIKKIVDFRKEGKFTEWAATAAGAVNNFVETSRVLFSRLLIYGKASFETLKTDAMIAFDGIALAVAPNLLLIRKGFNILFHTVKAQLVTWKAIATTVFRGMKNSAMISFKGIQIAGLKAFSFIAKKAQGTVNAIIASLNKIPGMDIAPVTIKTLDKAEEKVKSLQGEISEITKTFRKGGEVWQPIKDIPKDLKAIGKEAVAVDKELNKQFADGIKERSERLKENLQKYKDGSSYTEAIKKDEKETSKIQAQHEKIRGKIARWQERAQKSENDRKKASKETLDNLAEQNAELNKMKGIPLRGIFLKLGTGEPKTAVAGENMARAKAKQQDRLREEQLKALRAIRKNTEKGQKSALIW